MLRLGHFEQSNLALPLAVEHALGTTFHLDTFASDLHEPAAELELNKGAM